MKNLREMTIEELTALFYKGKEICYHWHFDKLDCSQSFQRMPVDLDFDKAMKHLNRNSLCTLIHRNQGVEDHWELGFRASSLNNVDYFMWIYIEPGRIDELSGFPPDCHIKPTNTGESNGGNNNPNPKG